MINPPNGQTSNFGSDDKSPKLSNSKIRMDDKSTQWSNISFLVDDKSTNLSKAKLGWMINPKNGQTSIFALNDKSTKWSNIQFWVDDKSTKWVNACHERVLRYWNFGHVLGLDPTLRG
jgi:hypothetical protein